MCVYHILQDCAQKLGSQSAWILWNLNVNNLYICKEMLQSVIWRIASVYFVRTAEQQTADNPPFDLRPLWLMKTTTFT